MKLLTLRANLILLVVSLAAHLIIQTGGMLAKIHEYQTVVAILSGLWWLTLLTTVALAAMLVLRLIISQATTETVEPEKPKKAELAGEPELRNLYDSAEFVERKLRKFRADREAANRDIDTIRYHLKVMTDLAYAVGKKSQALSAEAVALDRLNDALLTGDRIQIQRVLPMVRDAEIARMAGRACDNSQYQQSLRELVSRIAGESEAQALAYNEMLRSAMDHVIEAKSRLLLLQQAVDSSRMFEPFALLQADFRKVERAIAPFVVVANEAAGQIEKPQEAMLIEAKVG